MLTEIEHYQSQLKAHLTLKDEAEMQAGLMTEILNGHISSVYVDKKQAKHLLDTHKAYINWNVQKIVGIQSVISALVKAGETEKVSA